MLNNTIDKLYQLKLHGIAKALQDQMSNSATFSLSFEDRLSLLIDHEQSYRDGLRLERLLKAAKLKSVGACVEDIDYSSKRGLDKTTVANLISSDWVSKGFNLIITGPTGTGKTWLGCAFGNHACRKGYTVQFCRLPLLLEELHIAHGDGTYKRKLMQLAKVDLLILDDFGISIINSESRNDLLEIVDARTSNKSTLITSQLPIDKWHDYLSLGNPTVADAIMDRLLSNETRLTLSGESMRRYKR
jgi:DNA replication protein DnaC